MLTRIAPTPSGYLHAGNGASFVLTAQLARQAGGRLLLRIDDLDVDRLRPAYVQDIFEELDWLGIKPDLGPVDPDDLRQHWSQVTRLPLYHRMLRQLRDLGRLYACDCSRAQVLARTGNQAYDGHCRERALDLDGPGMAWRLRSPEDAWVELREWPAGNVHSIRLASADPVLRQRNGRPSFLIASLADDVHFGTDLLVRGVDLLEPSLLQVHLAQLLGLDGFGEAMFLHHGLLTDKEGMKLSKSAGSESLRAWRLAGRSPQEVVELAQQLGTSAQTVDPIRKGRAG